MLLSLVTASHSFCHRSFQLNDDWPTPESLRELSIASLAAGWLLTLGSGGGDGREPFSVASCGMGGGCLGAGSLVRA